MLAAEEKYPAFPPGKPAALRADLTPASMADPLLMNGAPHYQPIWIRGVHTKDGKYYTTHVTSSKN